MKTWSVVTDAGRVFQAALRERPGEALLAFDFDGTLAAIVPDPEDSRLHDRSAAALGSLIGRVGQMAVITGRNVETVRRLARLDERPELDGLLVVGGYGAESWVVGTGQVGAPARPAAVEEALPLVEQAIASCGIQGVVLEDKGRALGVHTRRSADPEGAYAALLPRLREIAAAHGLTVEPGRSVIELRSSNVTKGDAIRALVEETGARVVAMCGDDLGDLPAFEALLALRDDGLVTCRVVSASPEQEAMDEAADILAAGPDGIADWLSSLV